MAVSETARLIASLELDSRKFMAGADKALGKLNKLGVRSTAIGTAIGTSMSRLAEVGIRKVFGQLSGGLNSLAELEDATTSVDGAIKQLGLTGQVTSGQVAAWANEIEANVQAAFDDKAIAQSATTLLRYGKVAPKNLKPAMQVMTDLAAKTGSVESAAALLAKALADPEKAAGKLARSGVVLTKQQQAQIKAMVKAGKTAEAQAFLLGVLEKTTKGAAEAMHGPFRDSQLIFADVVEDAQRALATGFIPVLQEVRKELSEALAKPETLARIKEFGQGLAGGFREFVGFVKTVPWGQIATAVGGVVDFGRGLASAFMALPPEAKQMIIGLAALNKLSGGAVIKVGVDLAQGALGGLFQQFLGKGSPVNPMYVVPLGGKGLGPPVPGGGPVPTPGGGGAPNLLSTAATVAGGFLIVDALVKAPAALDAFSREITALSTGDIPTAKSALQDFANNLPAFMGGQKGIIEMVLKQAPTQPIPVTSQGMSPDERQAMSDQKAKLQRSHDAIERLRGAAMQRIDAGARTSANQTRTSGSAIEAAIRSLTLAAQITINVPGQRPRVYQTGNTLSRSGSGSGPGGPIDESRL